MVILENIDIDIDIDKAILQNIDIDKISNRFKFGISNRAIRLKPTSAYSLKRGRARRLVDNFPRDMYKKRPLLTTCSVICIIS